MTRILKLTKRVLMYAVIVVVLAIAGLLGWDYLSTIRLSRQGSSITSGGTFITAGDCTESYVVNPTTGWYMKIVDPFIYKYTERNIFFEIRPCGQVTRIAGGLKWKLSQALPVLKAQGLKTGISTFLVLFGSGRNEALQQLTSGGVLPKEVSIKGRWMPVVSASDLY